MNIYILIFQYNGYEKMVTCYFDSIGTFGCSTEFSLVEENNDCLSKPHMGINGVEPSILCLSYGDGTSISSSKPVLDIREDSGLTGNFNLEIIKIPVEFVSLGLTGDEIRDYDSTLEDKGDYQLNSYFEDGNDFINKGKIYVHWYTSYTSDTSPSTFWFDSHLGPLDSQYRDLGDWIRADDNFAFDDGLDAIAIYLKEVYGGSCEGKSSDEGLEYCSPPRGKQLIVKKDRVAVTDATFDLEGKYGLESGAQDDVEQFKTHFGDPLAALIRCDEDSVGALITQTVEDLETGLVYLNSFYCTQDNEWIHLLDMPDNDRDGSTNLIDCQDRDPSTYFPTQLLVKISGEEISDYGQTMFSICGDGIDNFCDIGLYGKQNGKSKFNDYLLQSAQSHDLIPDLADAEDWPELKWSIEDDCDYSPQSCVEQCKKQGGSCDYISHPNILDQDMGGESESDSDEGYQTDDVYDWSDLETGENFCCGAQLDDNGRILDYDNNNYVCINRESSFRCNQ